jgi:hypothetical protein
MSYLSLTEFSNITGTSLVGVNLTYLNFLLEKWSTQINQLTNCDFSNNDKNIEIEIKNYKCGNKILKFSPFIIISKVEIKKIGDSTWFDLIELVDYEYIYCSFDSYVANALIDKPIVGLDFSCLSCLCECEKVKITGDNRFSTGLVNELKNILIDLVYDTLDTDEKAYISQVLPNSKLLKQVESETDQTRTIKWTRNQSVLLQKERAEKSLNHLDFYSTVAKYYKETINITQTFNA